MTEREIAEGVRLSGPDAALSLRRVENPAHAELYEMLRSRFLPLLSYGTSGDSGQDLLQELYQLMLDAIEGDHIDDLDSLVAYARGIARHLRSRAIMQQSQRMRKIVPLRSSHDRRSGSNAEDAAVSREEAAELAGIFHALMAGLTPAQRDLVLRYFFRGETTEVIRADLKISIHQLHGRMRRLRKRLKADYQRLKLLSPASDNPPPLKEPV